MLLGEKTAQNAAKSRKSMKHTMMHYEQSREMESNKSETNKEKCFFIQSPKTGEESSGYRTLLEPNPANGTGNKESKTIRICTSSRLCILEAT